MNILKRTVCSTAVASVSLLLLLAYPGDVPGRLEDAGDGRIVESRTGEVFPATYYLSSGDGAVHLSAEKPAPERPAAVATAPGGAGVEKSPSDKSGAGVRPMTCVGAGVRTFFTFKIYALASYVNLEEARKDFYARGPGCSGGRWGQDGDEGGEEGGLGAHREGGQNPEPDDEFFSWFVYADFPKHFVMRFCRDVTRDQIRDSFREGLEKNLGDLARVDIAGDVELLLGFCRENLAEGEEVWVTTLSGGTVRLHVPRRGEITLRNRKIADGLVAIWLGQKPISKSLKKEMIRELPGRLLRTDPQSPTS